MPLGTEVIDLVLRVLAALDDEVVQQDQQRSAADVARCAALKDGMRDSGAGLGQSGKVLLTLQMQL